jgi:hypothetical protein
VRAAELCRSNVNKEGAVAIGIWELTILLALVAAGVAWLLVRIFRKSGM